MILLQEHILLLLHYVLRTPVLNPFMISKLTSNFCKQSAQGFSSAPDEQSQDQVLWVPSLGTLLLV